MAKRSVLAPKGIWPFTLAQSLYEAMAIVVVASAAYALGIILDARWASVPLAAMIVTNAVTSDPEEASFTQTFSGNLVAVLVSFVVIRAFGLEHGSSVDLLATFGPHRALGVLTALMATPIVCNILRIVQPTAGATAAFIVFCGVTPSQPSVIALIAEIILVSALSGLMRRWRVGSA